VSVSQGRLLVEVRVLGFRRAKSHMVLGYGLLTSQYGLTLDTVTGYELVLPNGTVVNVTSEDEDLWFGMRVSSQV
jgi:hypothetical protein